MKWTLTDALTRPRVVIDRLNRLEAARASIERLLEPVQAAPSRQSRGGMARAAALSPERRSEIARKAADARWGTGQRE